MKTLKSILAAAAAAALAVCAAQSASAATTYPDNLGLLIFPISYSFAGNPAPTGGDGNAYSFYFSTLQPWDALLAMQAQNSGPEKVQFELDELIGGNWTQISQSRLPSKPRYSQPIRVHVVRGRSI